MSLHIATPVKHLIQADNTGPADIDDSPRSAFRQSPNEGISTIIINHSIAIKILF